MGMETFELGLVSAEEGREVLETTRFCRQALQAFVWRLERNSFCFYKAPMIEKLKPVDHDEFYLCRTTFVHRFSVNLCYHWFILIDKILSFTNTKTN